MNSYQAMIVAFIVGFLVLAVGAFGLLAAYGGDTLYKDSEPTSLFSTPLLLLPAMPVVERRMLDSFTSAEETLASKFPDAPLAKEGEFTAYYFNASTSDWAAARPQTVDAVSLRLIDRLDPATGTVHEYKNAPPGSIDSSNLGAYWTGTFSLEKDTDFDLMIAQQWSHTRVVIDGYEVYDQSQQGTVMLTIPAGTHRMEVEHRNDWHTASLLVTLASPREGVAEPANPDRAKEWRVSIYEPSTFDHHVALVLPSGDYGPVVLHLTSYEPARWDFSEVAPGVIAKVVIASALPGGSALNVPEGIAVHYASEFPNIGDQFYPAIQEEGNILSYYAKRIELLGGVSSISQ